MKYIFIVVVLSQGLLSSVYKLQSGWNLIGLGKGDQNLSVTNFDSNVSSVWVYTQQGWKAFATSQTLQGQLNSSGIETLDSVLPGEGFWVNVDNDTEFTSSFQENISNSKVLTSNYTSQTDLSDEDYQGYTYNYVKGSGSAVSEYIDWENASSLSTAKETQNNKLLSKSISKVFSSSSKSHKLVIDSYDCGGQDFTLAITPYLSDGSIPGTSQNYWNKELPLEFDIYIPSLQTNTGLYSYNASNTYTQREPIRELSFDISLQDSTGKRVSLEDSYDLCTITGYSFYDIDFDVAQSIYSLHNIVGLEKFQSVGAISFSKLSNGKIKSSTDLNKLNPVVITREQTIQDSFVYDTSLSNITSAPFLFVRYPIMNNSVTYTVSNVAEETLLNSETITKNGLEIEKVYKINFTGLSSEEAASFQSKLYFYFLNSDLLNYKMYEYKNGKYTLIEADQISLDENSGKSVYHSGAYGISTDTVLVFTKPNVIDREVYIGQWSTYSYSSCCLANGGALDLYIKNSVVLGTANAGTQLIGIAGMPINGNSFSGYTADGTQWQGLINNSEITGQFNDGECCYGSFSAQK